MLQTVIVLYWNTTKGYLRKNPVSDCCKTKLARATFVWYSQNWNYSWKGKGRLVQAQKNYAESSKLQWILSLNKTALHVRIAYHKIPTLLKRYRSCHGHSYNITISINIHARFAAFNIQAKHFHRMIYKLVFAS